MPEEVEIETKELRETLDELQKERAERVEEARGQTWTRGIALVTALLAVIAAVAALISGKQVNEALIKKNESVLKQTQASDQWSYYQAKGIKFNTAQQTADLLAAMPGQQSRAARYAADADRYKHEQEAINEKAKELEKERDASSREANTLLEHHHAFAFSVTFTQVAIALCAIAALTKRKTVWYLSILVGLAGLTWFLGGLLHIVH